MARLENALRRCSSIPGLSLVFCLLLAGTAMAAGGQDGGGGASALIDLGKRLLNFALLVIILGWVINTHRGNRPKTGGPQKGKRGG